MIVPWKLPKCGLGETNIVSFVFIIATLLATAFVAITVLFARSDPQGVRSSLLGQPIRWDSPGNL
jgi:hypothetical protein